MTIALDESFMAASDHLDRLVATLPQSQQELYRNMKNSRLETAYRDRTFILYEMKGRDAHVLDKLIVLDFECDDSSGGSCEIRAERSKEVFVVSYTPRLITPYPVFMFMPLHAKLRWSAKAGAVHQGSLGFPIVIRTQTRLHARERGVTYCETGVTFSRDFPHITSV